MVRRSSSPRVLNLGCIEAPELTGTLADAHTSAVHVLAPGRPTRPHPTAGLQRWLTIAMVAWLGLVLAGREHVLQAFGIHLACVHPGGTGERSEPAVRTHGDHAQHGDGEHGSATSAMPDDHDDVTATSDHDDGDGDDCPPGCTECACGAAPCAPSMPHVIAERLWTLRDFEATPPLAGTSRDATTFERPPRRA